MAYSITRLTSNRIKYYGSSLKPLVGLQNLQKQFYSSNSVEKNIKSDKNGKYEVEYKKSLDQSEKYWFEKQKLVKWFKEPTKILDSNYSSPFQNW